MRLYLDTSVLGVIHQTERPDWAEASRQLLDSIVQGLHEAFVGTVLLEEMRRAPREIQVLLEQDLKRVEPAILEETDENLALTRAYIEAGGVVEEYRDDARHAALATVAHLDALVSWNFRHLVNVRRMHLVQGVYGLLAIVSPLEVICHEE